MAPQESTEEIVDYYEMLQISPKAQPETIHRVYRMMAARLHPDNRDTGDAEKFLILTCAYEVLSDPERRAAYDIVRERQQAKPIAVFNTREFMEGMEGEINRRMGVLSLLYNQRRMDENQPGLSVLELEKRMNFPREHLHFTAWYLKAKGYVTVEDNADFVLTAAGVDYVELHYGENTVLRKLISRGEPLAGRPSGLELQRREPV
jgi:curved DNA-binding protein CbpA